jgi:maltose O-acetyltransferase
MSEYAPEIYIGNNAVVGAGSVVTKDILENYLAYGNPCRPVRFISEKDSKLNLL